MKDPSKITFTHSFLENSPFIELCHKHTLNGYDKRKYKTIDGIKREMDLKRIRWNKRCVLEWV